MCKFKSFDMDEITKHITECGLKQLNKRYSCDRQDCEFATNKMGNLTRHKKRHAELDQQVSPKAISTTTTDKQDQTTKSVVVVDEEKEKKQMWMKKIRTVNGKKQTLAIFTTLLVMSPRQKVRKKFSTKRKIRKKYILEGSIENLLCHYQFSLQSVKNHLYLLLGFPHARRFADLQVYSVLRQRRQRRKYEELSGQSPSGRKETRRSSTLS